MRNKKELIRQFFPTGKSRAKASKAIEAKTTRLLSHYPENLIREIERLKETGLSIREIYNALGQDPRVPEIAMHLAVRNQAKEIGEY